MAWYHVLPLRKNVVSSPISAHVASYFLAPSYLECVFQ